MAIIRAIRRFRPEIVICNGIEDRHPDHGRSSKLESDACFLSGLRKVETFWNEEPQQEWRPKVVYHYIQDRFIKPDFVIDITPYWERKMAAIKAFKSQFFNPDASEPETYISGENFLRFVEGRGLEMGHAIGVRYGEGFTVERMLKVENLFDVI